MIADAHDRRDDATRVVFPPTEGVLHLRLDTTTGASITTQTTSLQLSFPSTLES